MHAEDWLLAVLAIILPPIPVIVKRGFCSAECMYIDSYSHSLYLYTNLDLFYSNYLGFVAYPWILAFPYLRMVHHLQISKGRVH